jgi:hypothetical protein
MLMKCDWDFTMAEKGLRQIYEKNGLPTLNFDFSAFLNALIYARRKQSVQPN